MRLSRYTFQDPCLDRSNGWQDWQGQVTIASPTWRPAQVYTSADPRTLGVAVHWVRLEEGEPG